MNEDTSVVLTAKGKRLIEYCRNNPLPEEKQYGIDDNGNLIVMNGYIDDKGEWKSKFEEPTVILL